MTPEEAAERLRAAGHRVIEPKKNAIPPQPISLPGWSFDWKHRNCCDECTAALEKGAKA